MTKKYDIFEFDVQKLTQTVLTLKQTAFEFHQSMNGLLGGILDIVRDIYDAAEEKQRAQKLEPFPSLPKLEINSNNNNIKISDVFSKKELNDMPFLKDGKPRKRDDGVWEIRYRRNGYNESFSSKNLNIAKEKFKRFIFDLKKQPRQGSKKNFAEIAEIYLYKVKKPLLHEDSFKNNLVTYRNHILNHFGGKPIDKITPLDIQNVVNDLYEQGKTRTIEEVSTLLRGIFSFAISNKYLKESPLSAVLIPKHQRESGLALTKQEELELVEKLRNHSFEKIYLFMLYSGVRRTEALHLKWKDIDLKNNTVTCYCAKVKNLKKGQIVTRKFPIFPKLKMLLLTMDCGAPESRLFEFAESSVTNTIKKFLPNHKAHDLRHTFVTRARECGIERDLVSLWVGHSLGNNVTASVYTHFSEEYQQAEALKLNY